MQEGGTIISQQAINNSSFRVIISSRELDFSSYFTLRTETIAVNMFHLLAFCFSIFAL